MTKKVGVLIPFWVQEILKRNNLPLSACLKLEDIKPLMSVNDLVAFLTMQDPVFFKLVSGVDTFGILTTIWNDSIVKPNEELQDFFLKTLLPVSMDRACFDDVFERLFTDASYEDRFKEEFVICDLTPEVFGIVVYPGYFNKERNDIELQKKVCEEIIEILYRYSSFHEVAKTEFFKGYLELLSMK